MLAQFQSLYPTGSLISELIEIYNGKYIVRTTVQIEGMTRATGMAAAEILEEAEDSSRNRALMVLGIGDNPHSAPNTADITSGVQPSSPTNTHANILTEQSVAQPSELELSIEEHVGNGGNKSVPELATADQNPWVSSPTVEVENRSTQNQPPAPTQITATSDTNSEDWQQNDPDHTGEENTSMMSDDVQAFEDKPLPINSPVNSQFTSSYDTPEESSKKKTTTTSKRRKKNEPVDHSETIAKIDVEMERLGWTKDQGREHLVQTYGVRGRSLLSDEQLLQFLRHLESEPTPVDPLAGF